MESSSKRVLLAASCAACVLAASVGLALREQPAPVASIAVAGALEPSGEECELPGEPAQTLARDVVDVPVLAGDELSTELEGPVTVNARELYRPRTNPPAFSVSGRVVDQRGQPVENAEVRVSWSLSRTDRDGAFEIGLWDRMLEQVDAAMPLVVRKQGLQPALIENFGARILGATSNTLFHQVVLDDELSISGRLVDGNGRPVARGRVRLVDATPLVPDFEGSHFLEQASHTFDSSAGFRLGGLLPRSYVLECELHLPLVSFRTDAIPAGTHDLELRVPAGALIEKVHGYLLTSDGASLAGAKLDIAFQHAINNWWPKRSQLGGTPRATTAHGGGFELLDVPSANAWVIVEHPSILTQALPLAGLDLQRDVTLIARRRARFQLERFDENLPGLTLDLLESTNGAPALWEPSAGLTSYLINSVVALEGGSSKPLTTLEGRFNLVWRNEKALPNEKNVELTRREIELVAGQTTIVGP